MSVESAAGIPAELRPGDPGLFSGDWLAYAKGGDVIRYDAAFVGWLIADTMAGTRWECSRDVAQAVMGEQDRMRHDAYSRLLQDGFSPDAALRRVDEGLPPMRWDGDVMVIDCTALGGEVDRCPPNESGRYEVGAGWSWHPVDEGCVDVVHT